MTICPTFLRGWCASSALWALSACVGVDAPHVDPPAGQLFDLPRPTQDSRRLTYDIEARLFPDRKEIQGTARVTLRNTSNRSLGMLRFHLYLNAFAGKDTVFMRSSGGHHRRLESDPAHPGWIRIRSLQIDDRPAAHRRLDDGTVLHVELPTPLTPGQVATAEIGFVSRLPRLFARTGHAGELFMVAQWYPKLGFLGPDGTWHCPPFHSNAEFFGPFGRFKVSFTLPRDFVVGATGVEVGRSRRGARKTIVYQAETVHDFALVAWPHFVQQAHRLDGVSVRLLSVPGRAGQRRRLLRLLKESLHRLQRRFGRYPYPQLTVVDLPAIGRGAAGMEYPTLFTTMLPSWSPPGLHVIDELTVHELTHQYFQGIVASNETDEPWLDEGVTSYVSGVLLDEILGADRSFIDVAAVRLGQLQKNALAQLRNRPPAAVAQAAANLGNWRRYASTVYGRAASLLYTLHSLIGKERLMRGLTAYVRGYAFGHPTGADLRRHLLSFTPEGQKQTVQGLLNAVLDDGLSLDVGLRCSPGGAVARRQAPVAIPLSIHWERRDGSVGKRPWPADRPRMEIRDGLLLRAWLEPRQRLALDDTPLDNQCAVRQQLAGPTQVAGWLQQIIQGIGP